MRAIIAIPTYWGPAAGGSGPVFDHPTAVGGPETLSRCLESLAVLPAGDWAVCLVVAPTEPAVAEEAVARVRAIVAGASLPFPVTAVTPGAVARLAQIASSVAGAGALLALDGYGNVRNLCLLAPLLLGAAAVVLVDDDEVVEEPSYLARALAGLGVTVGGRRARGVAGPYRDREGCWRLRPPSVPWERAWGKIDAMNGAFAGLVEPPPRYKPAFLALGGNMVLARDLAASVPFDPWIRRGEDIDYVFNAWIHGFRFAFDRDLWIRHLPPPRGHSAARALAEDLRRFLRARAKMRDLARPENGDLEALSLDELQPYPGAFLVDGLESRGRACLRAMIEAGPPDLAAEARAVLADLAEGFGDALAPGRALADYRRIRSVWTRLTRALTDEPAARAALESVGPA